MPSYATEADLTAYAGARGYAERIPGDAPGRNALLEVAERDVDLAVRPGAREETGLIWTVATLEADLEPADRLALRNAVCAQAVYRIEMGPEFFVRAQHERVKTRSMEREGKLPTIGPEVWRELTHSGILNLTTRTGGRRDLTARDAGWGGDY